MLSYFGLVPHGSMLDIPNAALGMVYYTLWLTGILSLFPKSLQFLVASAAMASSIFLATQLLILSELCVLCWSTHVINSRLWWHAFSESGKASMGSTTPASGVKQPPKIKRV